MEVVKVKERRKKEKENMKLTNSISERTKVEKVVSNENIKRDIREGEEEEI